MWSYYGAKTRIAKYYPKPKHGKIREPFAGTARYSLEHFENEVLLIDQYDVIVKVWHHLQACSPKDILSLPRLHTGQNLSEFNFSCEGERLLMGFLIGSASFQSLNVCSSWGAERMDINIKRIASNLFKVKHWVIRQGIYLDADNELATWFIDPPYQFGGHKYKFGSKHINYRHLAKWSRERMGQVIVCENTKADWMDFVPMIANHGIRHDTTEAIWSNETTAYDAVQQKLIL